MAPLPTILCYAPHTIWEPHASWELTILNALQERGCRVDYILCDGLYSDCDVYQPSRKNGRTRPFWYCTNCRIKAVRRLKRADMPYKWLGSWLSREDKQAARTWVSSLQDCQLMTAVVGDWRIGEWVRSSVHVYFRLNELDIGDPRVRKIYRSYLYSGYIASCGLERLFKDLRPDIQLLFNGRMSSTRIALEIGKKNGVRTICEERGLVRERVKLIEGTHCLDFTSIIKLWHAWKDIPLSEDEAIEIDRHLQDRRHGKSSSLRPFSPPLSEPEGRRPANQPARSKPLWVLFTSSLDESASHDDEPRAFRSQEEWIHQVVGFFTRHPERELAIRVHPNAGSKNSFGINHQDQRFFRRLQSEVPRNVRIIPSDASVSSYDFMEQADVGLVWHSTTAIEMAALGKRVFRAADAWMKGLDCVEKIGENGSLEDRFELALMPDSTFDRLQTAIQARRWAYLLYFRSSYALPLVRQLDWVRTELLYDGRKDLRPGVCRQLDEIVSIFIDSQSADRFPTSLEAERQVEVEESLTARLLGLPIPARTSPSGVN